MIVIHFLTTKPAVTKIIQNWEGSVGGFVHFYISSPKNKISPKNALLYSDHADDTKGIILVLSF